MSSNDSFTSWILKNLKVRSRYRVIPKRFIAELQRKDCILSVLSGGLLLGNKHSTPHEVIGSGIKCLEFTIEGDLAITAEFEGWEYLLNKGAFEMFENSLRLLNDRCKEPFEEYSIPPDVVLIDCRHPIESKFLFLPGGHTTFIMNKSATKKYLLQINRRNFFGMTDEDKYMIWGSVPKNI